MQTQCSFLIIVICGPTASGKSSLALQLAQAYNGIIINADAFQVYKEIPILTDSPSSADKLKAPHYLYNHISCRDDYCVMSYIKEASDVINNEKGLKIVVGGTGFYIYSLLYGIHKIPKVELHANDTSQEDMYKTLQKVDPNFNLKPQDSKRILRSYCVYKQTGKPISFFYTPQNLYKPLGDKTNILVFFLNQDRKVLYENCNKRLEHLFKNGAIEEVAFALNNGLNSEAIGFQEIEKYLKKEINYQEALETTQQKTRNFAKKQITWFKNKMPQCHRVNSIDDILAILQTT